MSDSANHPPDWRTVVRDGVSGLIDIEEGIFALALEFGENVLGRFIFLGDEAAEETEHSPKFVRYNPPNTRASARRKPTSKAA